MFEGRMREVIREQVATSMAEFMANMNRGAGGDGAGGAGASGAGAGSTGAGGAGAGGAEAGRAGAGGAEAGGAGAGGAGASGVGPAAPEITRCRALTWWNGRIASMGIDAANGTPWTENIGGNVTSLRPTGIDEAVRMAYQLMGQIIQDKTDEVFKGEKRKGEGDRGGRGHKTAACWSLDRKDVTCFNCNEKGHRKRDCPKLKKNGQGGNNRRVVYKLGAIDAQQDPKVITGTFLLNNRYATALFDSGADKSFVSTNFSTLIDIELVELDTCYEVVNWLIEKYFELLGWIGYHDMMPLYCVERKRLGFPLEGKALIIEGNRNNPRLKIASCIKARKYIENGCELFQAQVTGKVSKEKRFKDALVI
ncbi:putative reverse transcriptase domain-containing protein [Tanacetum coccineum]